MHSQHKLSLNYSDNICLFISYIYMYLTIYNRNQNITVIQYTIPHIIYPSHYIPPYSTAPFSHPFSHIHTPALITQKPSFSVIYIVYTYIFTIKYFVHIYAQKYQYSTHTPIYTPMLIANLVTSITTLSLNSI